jgi:hypothetical protein
VIFRVVPLCRNDGEDGGSVFFRNVGIHLQDHTMSQPIMPQLLHTPVTSNLDLLLKGST